MATQIKFQVLAIGELTSGTGRNGNAWHRRALQIFVDQIAGNHNAYGEKEELEALQAGLYTADLAPQAGDRGAVEFRLSNLKPVVAPKAAQA